MREDGFLLIEALVALLILAVAGLALTHLAGESLRAAGALESRMLAGIVARNQLLETLAGREASDGVQHGRVMLAGREWAWTTRIAGFGDRRLPEMEEVTVTAHEIDRDGASLGPLVWKTRWSRARGAGRP